jgi:hypothetical protein
MRQKPTVSIHAAACMVCFGLSASRPFRGWKIGEGEKFVCGRGWSRSSKRCVCVFKVAFAQTISGFETYTQARRTYNNFSLTHAGYNMRETGTVTTNAESANRLYFEVFPNRIVRAVASHKLHNLQNGEKKADHSLLH